ncbi:MAG: hypothetical protein Q7S12_04080 [bacterium]|nr:hypothetical protein [bacterium]
MKEIPKQNEEPFQEELTPMNEFSVDIKSLKSRTDKLVRHWYADVPLVNSLDRKEIKKRREKNIAEFKDGIKDIRELSEHYNIALPDFEFVIGKRSGGLINVFTMIDKIDGENLWQIKRFPAEAKNKLDTFYSSMAQYYFDKYKNGGSYFYDFKADQFVYGHKNGEKENKIYMVDIEPRSDKHGDGKEDKAIDILGRANDVLDNMFRSEKKFEERARFDKTINTFKQNLNEISGDKNSYVNQQSVEHLKNKLKEY